MLDLLNVKGMRHLLYLQGLKNVILQENIAFLPLRL